MYNCYNCQRQPHVISSKKRNCRRRRGRTRRTVLVTAPAPGHVWRSWATRTPQGRPAAVKAMLHSGRWLTTDAGPGEKLGCASSFFVCFLAKWAAEPAAAGTTGGLSLRSCWLKIDTTLIELLVSWVKLSSVPNHKQAEEHRETQGATDQLRKYGGCS